MPTSSRHDPYPSFLFIVEIDGLTSSAFVEVTGLEFETEVIEYREGAEPRTSRKLPGLTSYRELVLTRGFSRNRELWDWARAIANGVLDRRNGNIILLDDARKEVVRWSFRHAWPIRWIGPSLDGGVSAVGVETIVLVHEGLELEIA